ncbi:MAG TPA: hypothetical protein VKY74_19665 [Chloroflexia bacterium]|nr:hypothetical protein [Chloroflexia bacterium]
MSILSRARVYLAPALALGLGSLAVGQQARWPYFVDYEVSLLPWLVGRGWVLYRDMVDQHTPLLPILLAGLGAGDPGLGLHLVILGLAALTLGLTYRVAAAAAGPGAGVVALSLTAIWAVAFEPTHLWYDGVLAPVYLAVLAILGGPGGPAATRPPLPGWRRAGIGGLLAVGMLLKQPAVLTVPFLLVAIALQTPDRRDRGVGALLAGLAAPLVLAAGLLALAGAAGAAWYWTVVYSLTSDYAQTAGRPLPVADQALLLAFYAPLAAGVLGAMGRGLLAPRLVGGAWPPRIAYLGVVLAASVPAWPRYGRYHFQAAVPLLAIAAVLAATAGWRVVTGREFRVARPGRRVVAGLGVALGAVLLGWYTSTGVGEYLADSALISQLGGPAAPYSGSIAPLRAWVDRHAPPGAPLVTAGLDALLYRVLEREPPRPWAPELPWIRADRDTDAQVWRGITLAAPPVALVESEGWAWAAAPPPGLTSGAARLRAGYHEAARFTLAAYPYTAPFTVVGLLRNDGPAP